MGLAKFLHVPEQLVTEDKVSFDLHVKWLHRENKKTDPDLEAVERKMEITFPYRREIVVKKGIGVKRSLLKCFHGLHLEMRYIYRQ